MSLTCDEITALVSQGREERLQIRVVMDYVNTRRLAEAFGVTLEIAEKAQADLGHLFRERAS